jgi:hypothetical protein
LGARHGLINLHSLPRRRPAYRWHLGVVCFTVVFDRFVVDVGLEALVEVVCAHASNDDGEDKKQNSEYGKGSQGLACWHVIVLAVEVGNVHADELEQEVGHGDKVHDDDSNHAGDRFATDPPCGEEEQEEGDDQCDGGEGEFDRLGVADDDQELHCKCKEEEEVELEQSNVNL